MLDIKIIREDPGLVRESLEKRGNTFAIDSVIELDEHYRSLLRQTEELRAQHNETSKKLGATKEKSPELIAQMRQLGHQNEIGRYQSKCFRYRSRLWRAGTGERTASDINTRLRTGGYRSGSIFQKKLCQARRGLYLAGW